MIRSNTRHKAIASRALLSSVVALLVVSAFFLGARVATDSTPIRGTDQDVWYEDGSFYVPFATEAGSADTLVMAKQTVIGFIQAANGMDDAASAAADASAADDPKEPRTADFKWTSQVDGQLYAVRIEEDGMVHFVSMREGEDAFNASVPSDVVLFASEHQKGIFYRDLNIFSLLLDTESGLTRWSFVFSPSFWQLVVYIAILFLLGASLLARRLKLQTNRLAEENRRLLIAREKERKRLAAEIHDGPIQDAQLIAREYAAASSGVATALVENKGTAGRATDRPASRRLDTAMEQLVDRLRDICADLRPPVLYHFGLADAIRTRAGEFQERFPETRFETYVQPVGPLPEATRIGLFRIAQEAMGNAVKHANATRISVRLFASDSNLAMWIEDDGVGFSPRRRMSKSSKHQGMSLMTHLASAIGAEIEVTSQPAEGTSILVDLPLPKEVAVTEERDAVLVA